MRPQRILYIVNELCDIIKSLLSLSILRPIRGQDVKTLDYVYFMINDKNLI